MYIDKVIVSPCMGGYYYDDYNAIKEGREMDGFFYLGEPTTPGHKKVRNPGETISIIFLLSDGQISIGDCVAIQYSGVVNRDPVLLSNKYIPFIKKNLVPLMEGLKITSFREMAETFDKTLIDATKLHSGIRYGVSQAILDAVSKKHRLLECEVVAKEYGTVIRTTPIPVLAQSADDRYINADKMILKSVPVIPQGLFNHINKVGENGELLLQYTKWLKERVDKFGELGYKPGFHLDVYGMIGKIFNNNITDIVKYLNELEEVANPYLLNIEDPIEYGSREGLIKINTALVKKLNEAKSSVEITSDSWCNTLEDIKEFVDAGAAHMIQIKTPDLGSLTNSIEAVIYCKKKGVKAFLGGTCNGTDNSSRHTVQCALATDADLIYNKPGMGVDEGYLIVFNEMSRTLAILKEKNYELHLNKCEA